RQRRSDTLAARVLGLGPPRQQERTAAPAQRTSECDPRRLRPFLFGPRGRMKQYAVGLSARFRDNLAREPIIDGATGGITEREAGQRAIARDGMEVARYAILNIVEPRRRPLTNAVRVVAVPAAASQPRDERGAHEPLGVDDIVVAARAHGAPEARNLAHRRRCKRCPPPAARCDRDDLRDGGMNLHERCNRLLHHPAKPRGRPLAPRLRQRWHVMDHVAERGGLDEQDVGHRQKPRRSGAASAGLSADVGTCMHASKRMFSTPEPANARRYQRVPSVTVLLTGGATAGRLPTVPVPCSNGGRLSTTGRPSSATRWHGSASFRRAPTALRELVDSA